VQIAELSGGAFDYHWAADDALGIKEGNPAVP